MADSKAVVKKDDAKLPAAAHSKFAAAGEKHQEVMGKDDMSIPFIQILQQLSPQCTKGKPEFIKGAEPSELLNTVSQKRWKTRDDDDNPIVGMRVIGVAYKRSFIEWVPRNQGGGIIQEYSVEEGLSIVTRRNESNLDIIQESSPVGTPGNQLNDTHTHYVFIVDDEGRITPAVLTMSSTQIKPSKDWNNLIAEQIDNSGGYPRFSWTWDVTTVQRTNDQGSWYVWKFENPTRLDQVEAFDDWEAVFDRIEKFADGIKAGEHKVDHSKAEGEANPSTEGKGGEGNDDEVPF